MVIKRLGGLFCALPWGSWFLSRIFKPLSVLHLSPYLHLNIVRHLKFTRTQHNSWFSPHTVLLFHPCWLTESLPISCAGAMTLRKKQACRQHLLRKCSWEQCLWRSEESRLDRERSWPMMLLEGFLGQSHGELWSCWACVIGQLWRAAPFWFERVGPYQIYGPASSSSPVAERTWQRCMRITNISNN